MAVEHAPEDEARTRPDAARPVVVPLLDREYSSYALELAARLARPAGAAVLIVAPQYIAWALPLEAAPDETDGLRAQLNDGVRMLEARGVVARALVVRARHGAFGRALAAMATDAGAALIMLGLPAAVGHALHGAHDSEVASLLRHDASCPVVVVTGPPDALAARAS